MVLFGLFETMAALRPKTLSGFIFPNLPQGYFWGVLDSFGGSPGLILEISRIIFEVSGVNLSGYPDP